MNPLPVQAWHPPSAMLWAVSFWGSQSSGDLRGGELSLCLALALGAPVLGVCMVGTGCRHHPRLSGEQW